MSIEQLKHKKIAIVGLGVNNQKMAEYFTRREISYESIKEWKSPDELIGILDHFNIIFRTPGLPYLSKAIQQAKKAGVEISSQTKLFFELCPAQVIAVTGTKGKGTTSSLIAKILETAGKKVYLGGNFGRDPFEFLDELKPTDFVVLELSSFQLQDLEASPHIAVVLNITEDHMNHHQTMDEYVHAKSQIIAFQKPQDFAVLHPKLPDWLKELGQGKKVFFVPSEFSKFETKLLGEHNLDNIAAAATVAKILKIDEALIQKTVAEFEPLPHRLKVLGTFEGITYVDDGFSTNIEPTMAAIDSLSGKIILIVGGSDKGLNFQH
jgi:UDP-N-acetylmuramoylalanine--D-glutamate ligase